MIDNDKIVNVMHRCAPFDRRAHPRAGFSARALSSLGSSAKQFAFMKVKCYKICNGPDRLPPPDPKTRSWPEPRQSSMGLFLSWPLLSWPLLSWPLLSWPLLSWPLLSWPLLSWPLLSWPRPPGRAPSGGRGAVAPPSRDRASDARLPLRDTKVLDWLRLSATWRLGLFSHGLLGLLNLQRLPPLYQP